MRKSLVLAACLGFLLLAGCNRCAMWDWYCPCDLIEGSTCDPLGPRVAGPTVKPGTVVKREWAVPAASCKPVPPPAVLEAPADAPAEAPAEASAEVPPDAAPTFVEEVPE